MTKRQKELTEHMNINHNRTVLERLVKKLFEGLSRNKMKFHTKVVYKMYSNIQHSKYTNNSIVFSNRYNANNVLYDP